MKKIEVMRCGKLLFCSVCGDPEPLVYIYIGGKVVCDSCLMKKHKKQPDSGSKPAA